MALLLLLIAGGYGFGGDLYVTARDLVALRKERELLAAEVEDRVIDTDWLTSARFEPTAPRRGRRRRWIAAGVALLLLLIAGGYGFGGDLYVTARDLVALRKERELLAAEVERLQTELAVESATRLELERQAADLNAQVAELKGQVAFLRARRPPGKSAE